MKFNSKDEDLQNVRRINIEKCIKEDPGTSLRPFKLRGLESVFPETVYLLRHALSGTCATIFVRQKDKQARLLSGVVCFTTSGYALDFSFDKPGRYEVVKVSFDEAHDIAQCEMPPQDALVLADDPHKPKLHHVR